MNLTLSAILGLALALGASLIGNYVQHNKAVALAAVVKKDKAEGDTAMAQAETHATQAARAVEMVQAAKQAEIAESYEKGKVDAKAAADKFVADLRADNIRLRNRWQGCQASRVPETAAAASQPDAAERDR